MHWSILNFLLSGSMLKDFGWAQKYFIPMIECNNKIIVLSIGLFHSHFVLFRTMERISNI